MNCINFTLKSASRLLAAATLGFVASSASAAVTDLGELQLDSIYEIKGNFGSYIGHVTAPKSGVLTYTYTNTSFAPYADADHTQPLESNGGGHDSDGYHYTMSVEQGKTYYFYDSFAMDDGIFVVSMANGVKLSSVTVAEGENLSISGMGTVEYIFNQSIAVDGVTFASGTKKKELSLSSGEYRVNGARLTVDYAATLTEWLNDGSVKEGDKATIAFSGLRSYADSTALYNGTGSGSFTYNVAKKAATLVSATTVDGTGTLSNGGYATVKFLSYFAADDNNGKYSVTFSEPIDSVLPSGQTQFAYLIWGENSESDDVYQEWLPVTFSNDNKTLTVDCTGKLRSLDIMSPTKGTNYGYITLKFLGLKTEDGQYVATGTSANQGSFSFNFYYSVVSSTVATRFRPADTFGNAETLTVQVTGYDEFTFSGVKFAWDTDSVVVAKSELTITPADGNAATILVPIPAAARTATDVTVSFTDMTFTDGVDHSELFTKTYNAGSSSVIDITADADNAASVEYYTLQGVRVTNPAAGIYIVKRGNTATLRRL